jgi:hypothetical protein
MYVDGSVSGEFIQFSHTKNSATIGGVGVVLGANASVSDEYGHFFVSGRKLEAVVDNPYSKTNYIVESMDALPQGWVCSKSLDIFAGSGAGTDYQLILKAYYGSGTDGTETLNEETIAKFYCNSNCRTDFGDIRFLPSNSTTPYTYKLCSKVDGEWAVFAVKISDDLDINQTIRAAYNNPNATDASSDSTFIDVIDDVVFAAPMNEPDQEVNPITINDNYATWWVDAAGAPNGTLGMPVKTIETRDGYQVAKIITGAGNNTIVACGVLYSNLGVPLDLSAKSRATFLMWGSNSGNTVTLQAYTTPWTAGFHYDIIDNFTGMHKISIPLSSFNVNGTPNWGSIVDIRFNTLQQGEFVVSRVIFDDGVPVTDYSGNSNNGAATGTSIADSRWDGKTARQINGITDHINCGNDTDLRPTDELTLMAWMKQTQEKPNFWELTIAGSEDATRGFILRGGKSTAGNYINLSAGNGTVWNDGVWPAYNFQLDTWYHVAGTVKSNDKIRVYVNGNEVGNGDFSGNPTQSTVAFWIGSTQIYPTRTYAGLISDALLFNRALSATEIETLYANYSDASLISGSVCVRKWATILQPTFGEWSA